MNAAHTRANNQVDKEFKQNEAMIRESLANYEEIKGVIRDITIPDSQLRLVLYERFPDELERDLPEIRTLLNGKKKSNFQSVYQQILLLQAIHSKAILLVGFAA
jgi:hypothetical protein